MKIAGRMAASVVVGLGLAASLASPASAYVYWDGATAADAVGGEAIGTVNPDGTNLHTFTAAATRDSGAPTYSAVASDGTHVYFSGGTTNGDNTGTIGRLNADGTGFDRAFVPLPSIDRHPLVTLPSSADAIAVDGSYIWWADTGNYSIGRASLDGSNPVEQFIPTAGTTGLGPEGVASNGSNVYWSNPGQNEIGRAQLDGSGTVVPGSIQQNFITGATGAWSVALFGSYLYWTNTGTAKIGRVQLDATGAVVPGNIQQSFISGLNSYHNDPNEIAVGASGIYWTNLDHTIGRANLDGTGAVQNFVPNAPTASVPGLAVDSLTANPTVTSVSCNPSTLQVLDPHPPSEVYAPPAKDTATCTATVHDTGPSSRPLNGRIGVSQSPPEGDIGTPQGYSFEGCLLTPSATPGQASCTFKYTTDKYAPGFVPRAPSVQLTASYSGETTHTPGSGTTNVALVTVHPCHLVVASEASYYNDLCDQSGKVVVTLSGGGHHGGGGHGGTGGAGSSTVTVGGGSITLSGPTKCVATGHTASLKLTFKPRGKLVKVSRADFSLGSSKLSVKHAPFTARIKLKGKHTAKLKLTVKAYALLKHGQRVTKTLQLTLTVC